MKNKIYILCALSLFSASLKAQTNIVAEVNEYDLGAWAYTQHNDICSKIHPAVDAGKITAYGSDNKPLGKAQALRMLESSYVAFLSTNPYDPTEGRDTTVWAPVRTNFYAFTIGPQQVKLMRDKNGKIVYFDKAILYRLLSDENLLYLERYAEKGVVLFESIPKISRAIMASVNEKLLIESRKPGTELFKTDSLLTKYNAFDQSYRGSTQVAIFISTDPDDPTIGRDSFYTEEMNIKDTSYYQGLYLVMKMQNFHMDITAISLGFHPSFASMRLNAVLPLGFIKYDKAVPALASEKKLLEYCLAFCLKERIEGTRIGNDEYMEAFKLKR